MKAVIVGKLPSIGPSEIIAQITPHKSGLPLWIRETKGFPSNIDGASKEKGRGITIKPIDLTLTKSQQCLVDRINEANEFILHTMRSGKKLITPKIVKR